jgi:hypothetical protein
VHGQLNQHQSSTREKKKNGTHVVYLKIPGAAIFNQKKKKKHIR